MLKFARAVVNEHKEQLGVPYPPSSRPGEFPRRRTGNLRKSTVVRPIRVDEIRRTGQVKVGFLERAFYGEILEYSMDRMGLSASIDKVIRTRVKGGRLPQGLNWIRHPYKTL